MRVSCNILFALKHTVNSIKGTLALKANGLRVILCIRAAPFMALLLFDFHLLCLQLQCNFI